VLKNSNSGNSAGGEQVSAPFPQKYTEKYLKVETLTFTDDKAKIKTLSFFLSFQNKHCIAFE
jgi:hypothetical protein